MSRSRCSTPGSTARSRTCAAACCRATTSSGSTARRSPGRSPATRRASRSTGPSSPVSSSEPAAPRGSPGSRRARRSCRSASRGGRRTPRAAGRSTRAPTSSSRGSNGPSTRTRTVTPAMRRGSPSSGSRRPLRHSPTIPSRSPRTARDGSARWWSRPPETTVQPGRASAASPGPGARRPRSPSAPQIYARRAAAPVSWCAPGSVCCSTPSCRSPGRSRRAMRSGCGSRSRGPGKRARARPGSTRSSTGAATASSRAGRRSFLPPEPRVTSPRRRRARERPRSSSRARACPPAASESTAWCPCRWSGSERRWAQRCARPWRAARTSASRSRRCAPAPTRRTGVWRRSRLRASPSTAGSSRSSSGRVSASSLRPPARIPTARRGSQR